MKVDIANRLLAKYADVASFFVTFEMFYSCCELFSHRPLWEVIFRER